MLTPEEEAMTEQTNSGSCCDSCGTGAATDVQVHGSGVTTVYKVSGMTCGHCESAISKEVSALDGVTAVTAVADTGEVTVTSAAPLDQEAVRAAAGTGPPVRHLPPSPFRGHARDHAMRDHVPSVTGSRHVTIPPRGTTSSRPPEMTIR